MLVIKNQSVLLAAFQQARASDKDELLFKEVDDAVNHLEDLAECYDKQKDLPDQAWYDVDDLTFTDMSEEEIDKKIGAISRLFAQEEEGRARFLVRDDRCVKELLAEQLIMVEDFLGKETVTEVCGDIVRCAFATDTSSMDIDEKGSCALEPNSGLVDGNTFATPSSKMILFFTLFVKDG